MNVDVAAPPVAACVAASDLATVTHGATFFVVAGKPAGIAEFLREATKSKTWVLASRAQGKGVETAVLRGALQMPYREIGGLVFLAQNKRLAVTFTTYPAICEVEHNAQKN